MCVGVVVLHMVNGSGSNFSGMTVLCSTDFSESSIPALQWAVNISKLIGAHLALLHTYRLVPVNGKATSLKKEIEDQARTKFSGVEIQYLKGQGISYDFRTEVGFVADRVEDFAKNNRVAFLVISKDATGKDEEGFDDLMKQIHFPLVIIPKQIL